MSEEQRKQAERICAAVDGLDASEKETVLAYIHGLAVGAQLAAVEKRNGAAVPKE
jgi:hypothetical protein